MKKIAFLLISLVLMVIIALSGCDKSETITANKVTQPPIKLAQSSIATKKPQKAFTVTLRHTLVKDTSKLRLNMLAAAAAAAESAVPGLHMQLEGVDETINRSSQLKEEMTMGKPPDIFELFGGEKDAFAYAKLGKLLDLTPILSELEKQYDFASLQDFTIDGKIVGLPMTGQVEGIFYNKKIFADLGIRLPATYADFLNICELAKAKGITPLALSSSDAWVPTMLLNTLLVRNAGIAEQAGFMTGAAKWTDAPVVEAFTQYEALVTKGFFQEKSLGLKYADQQNQFKTGKAAMLFDGSWIYPSLIDPGQSQIANDVGFFSFPNMGGRGDGLINGSYNQGYGFSAQLSDPQKEAVKQFIKNMFNDEMQKRQMTEEGLLPSMFLVDNTGVQPLVTEITAAAKGSSGTFASMDSLIQKSVMAQLEEGIQQLLEGKITAVKLAEKVQMAQETANIES